MQIHHVHTGGHPGPEAPHLGRAGGRQASAASDTDSSPRRDTNGLDHSAEVRDLLARLKAVPEVRDSLVEQATRRLIRGEYQTRQSAEETAAAILG